MIYIEDWKIVEVHAEKGKFVWRLRDDDREAWFTTERYMSFDETRDEILRQMGEWES